MFKYPIYMHHSSYMRDLFLFTENLLDRISVLFDFFQSIITDVIFCMWWNSWTAAAWGYSTVFLWFLKSVTVTTSASACSIWASSAAARLHRLHRLHRLPVTWLKPCEEDRCHMRNYFSFFFNSTSDLWPLLVISPPPNFIPYLHFGDKNPINNMWARKNDRDK